MQYRHCTVCPTAYTHITHCTVCPTADIHITHCTVCPYTTQHHTQLHSTEYSKPQNSKFSLPDIIGKARRCSADRTIGAPLPLFASADESYVMYQLSSTQTSATAITIRPAAGTLLSAHCCQLFLLHINVPSPLNPFSQPIPPTAPL